MPTALGTPAQLKIFAPAAKSSTRNLALDTYRGFVMLLMMAEVLELAKVARAFPNNWFWSFLAYNQTHVEWAGCSLHDLIQPSFSFLVGAVLPYSLASRLAKGATFGNMFLHTLWRSVLLIALGIFLRSLHSTQTNFTFEDTLTQIGLGYPFLFLLGFRSPKQQWIAFSLLLTGYWLLWALYPVPFFPDTALTHVPANWPYNFTGFLAHWNKNANLGASFDRWFLNLLPREKPFIANNGGYLTLSFIPTLGTMILGLIAGRWLRSKSVPLKRFVLTGIIGIALGLLLHALGICPVVKRIWTPAWTLFSGGACFLLLALFSWMIDVKGYHRWTFPLMVIGTNSIAAYLIAHLFERFIADSFQIHLGPHIFQGFGQGLEPLLRGLAILLTYWLILFWMFRRKLFLRI